MTAPLDLDATKARLEYNRNRLQSLSYADENASLQLLAAAVERLQGEADALVAEVERQQADALIHRRVVGTEFNLPIHFSQYIPALEAEIGRLREQPGLPKQFADVGARLRRFMDTFAIYIRESMQIDGSSDEAEQIWHDAVHAVHWLRGRPSDVAKRLAELNASCEVPAITEAGDGTSRMAP